MIANTEIQKYRCIKPKILTYYTEPIAVPCGKCLYCRQQKASEWTTRLELEYLDHKTSSFLTLTYREVSPFEEPELFDKSRNLCYRDIQTFMKRARIYIKRKYNKEFRFFVTGENGKRATKRAHWHFIIFGLNAQETAEIKKIWEYGEIGDCQEINGVEGVAKYVSQYVLDKIDLNPDDYERERGHKPPIHRSSKSIGLNQALELFTKPAQLCFEKFGDLNNIAWKGKRLKLCRYLRNKICEKLEILDEVKKQGIAKLQDYMNETIALYQSYKVFSPNENEHEIETLKFLRPQGEIARHNENTPIYEQEEYERQREQEILISNAWEYRHRRKYKAMQEKFKLYLLDKETKAVI